MNTSYEFDFYELPRLLHAYYTGHRVRKKVYGSESGTPIFYIVSDYVTDHLFLLTIDELFV